MTAAKPLIFMDPFPRTEEMVYTPDAAQALDEMGQVISHFGSRAPDDLVEEVLPQVSVIIGQTAMPAERFAKAPNLRAIVNVKGNWEASVDYQEAASRNIYVLSAAPAMAPAVAEYCVAQAISLARRLPACDQLFRSGQEKYGIAGNQDAKSLYDAQVGMIGFGNVGRELALLLKPFRCNIRAFDPWLSAGFLQRNGVMAAELDEVLSASDFLFLLASPTTENAEFLDRAQLESIKDDACVVLASRAEIVDFPSFIDLAQQGNYRAAIDVYPQEPVDEQASWRQAAGVHFSAHVAGGLHASYRLIREMMIEDVGQILKGLPPLRMQRAEAQLAGRMRSR